MSAFKTARAGAIATAFATILLTANAQAAAYVPGENPATMESGTPARDEPFGLSTSALTEAPESAGVRLMPQCKAFHLHAYRPHLLVRP